MPYGVREDLGGDSTENDTHIERMVAALQKEGHDKVSAIRIAKATFDKEKDPPKKDPPQGRKGMGVDKTILRAAVANLRKGLRTHGGKSLLPEAPPPVPEGTTQGDEDKAIQAEKIRKKA